MANILYGVNGEGSGHSTRSKEVLRHLQQRGHTVHVVSFDRGLANLKDEFEVTEIYGLRFAYVENRVRYRKTVLKNLLSAPQAARSLRQLLRWADAWRTELVITDFEPLSYRLARHRKLPVICIDNQHCLTHAKVEYPRRYRKEAATAKLVTRLMIPRADAYLITSFFEAPVRKPNAWIVPPILRREVIEARPTDGDYTLVYVTAPSAELAALLRTLPFKFVCYGFGQEGRKGNCDFRKPGLERFLADLAGCAAVVANSGFSLLSEALHLGKPYLAWPVRRQFEQIFNAHYVAKMRYGAYWDDLNGERIGEFHARLPEYRQALGAYPRQDNRQLCARVDEMVERLLGRARAAWA